ncbi:Threonine/homoserine efflux transporter RhtA [Flavobacteriaceae bacterium MAR_2010_188]|nr:Threonine/homoserine efflux transporter RhtA [Flavobacteriaceae bacterium MAR_2010_188]
MPNAHNKQLAILLLATVIISTSGTLGRFIDMPVPVIIWWRCALGGIFLYVYCLYKKIPLGLKSKQHRLPFLISAVFLGAHWITYFYALKFSNVAIGVLSLFTFPVMTALMEPLFIKVKLDPVHLVLGGIVLCGIYILVPDFDLDNDQVLGVLFGIFSAFCYSIRILILKQQSPNYNGTFLMFYQVLILSILLLPVMFLMDSSAIKTQFPYVLILALLTTAIGHTLFISTLRYFKVSTATIIGSAQPIYGIIIAYFFLNEIPSKKTLLGGILIISTVIIESIRSKRVRLTKPSD